MTTLLKNRYCILNKLGSGGFGETSLAEDLQMPSHRQCVIKQLKPIANDPQTYQLIKDRFQREAAILERLGEKNPYIPTLYAYFEDDDQFYLVEEYIQGVTLAEKIQRDGVLTESSVRDILIYSLSILDYIHSQGIVHRDIKPDNIILRSSDHLPVLIDFGAVKETMGTIMTTSGHSTRSIVIGTPGFMSSEQNAGRPTFSSDLYSLALTAIYLLTGKLPQEFNVDPLSGDILWRQEAPLISSQLAAILDKAIQYYQRDRYQIAREMLSDIQNQATPLIIQTSHQNPITSTVVSQHSAIATTTITNNSSPSGLKNWQIYTIIGSIISIFIMAGVAVFGYFNNKISVKPTTTSTPILPPTPTITPSDVITPSPEPTIEPSTTPSAVTLYTFHTNLIPLGEYSYYEKGLRKNVSYVREGNLMVGALYDSQQTGTYTCFAADIQSERVYIKWWGNLWQIKRPSLETYTTSYSISDFTVDNIMPFSTGLENPQAVQQCQNQQ